MISDDRRRSGDVDGHTTRTILETSVGRTGCFFLYFCEDNSNINLAICANRNILFRDDHNPRTIYKFYLKAKPFLLLLLELKTLRGKHPNDKTRTLGGNAAFPLRVAQEASSSSWRCFEL